MPSDCQNLGGHRHIHPIERNRCGGNCPLLPRLPRPCITLCLVNIPKHTHPLYIVRVTSSALRKIEKHPTLGHSQQAHTPPPPDIARVTSSTFQWMEGDRPLSVPVTHTLHRFSGSGQVQGGDHSCHPPPGSATTHVSLISGLRPLRLLTRCICRATTLDKM